MGHIVTDPEVLSLVSDLGLDRVLIWHGSAFDHSQPEPDPVSVLAYIHMS